ncbi:MAG: hypothetical protein KIT36_21575 [Alphaproteobacteria bacterium]|nr:hypothetical protein [Alphaproteobacteria bacterium]
MVDWQQDGTGLGRRTLRVLSVVAMGYVVLGIIVGWSLVAAGGVPPWRENSPFEVLPGLAAMLLAAAAALAYLLGSPAGDGRLRLRGLLFAAALFLVGLEEAVALHKLIGSELVMDMALWAIMAVAIRALAVEPAVPDRAVLFLWAAWAVHGLSVVADGAEDGAMASLLSPATAVWIDEFLEYCYVPLYALATLTLPMPAATTDGDGATHARPYVSFVGAALRGALVIWGDLTFGMFRLRYPRATFADFYAHNVARKLDRGASHPTLGKRKRVRRTGKTIDLTTAKHATRGGFVLDKLLARGLRRDHIVVDYGCGSLRVGQHFIEFLDPGNYWGLDVTDRFFRDGLELLPAEVIEARRPNLAVIEPPVLRRVAALAPDFIVCVAVVMHVPPEELDGFIAGLLRLRGTHGVISLWFDEAPQQVRTQAKAWAYPRETLIAAVRRGDPSLACRVETFDSVAHRHGGLPVTRSILWIG